MALIDDKTVQKFFRKLAELKDEGFLDDECEQMVEKEPKLLSCKCPNEVARDLGGCVFHTEFTAAEYLCSNHTVGSRDLLVELVELGAMATDKCYDLAIEEVTSSDFIAVLLLSGYLPDSSSGSFFLDCMVEFCDDKPELLLGDIMRLLQRKGVQAGDSFGFGEIKACSVKKLENLPELQAGVTHEEGGSFAKFLENYEPDDGDVDDDDAQPASPSKKQRVQ